MIRAAVCVPVRNERAMLPGLVAALGRQRGVDGVALSLCCFFDGCDDGSEAVVGAGPGGWALRGAAGPRHDDANAGRARGRAMALGLEALGAAGGVLLCTDADSAPAPDWLAAALRSLDDCDLVAGLIERDCDDAGHARLEAYYDRLYLYRRAVDPVPWEPAPGHHYTGGANLAMWAAAYRAAGGFRPLPHGEDAVLVDDAARAGLRVRRDCAVRVRTSARRDGRAPGGLAAALRHGDRHRGAVEVGDPAACAWQYARHAAARAAWPQLPERAAPLADRLGVAPDHLLGVARDCSNAEAFAMRVVPAAPDAARRVPLPEAERALARLEAAGLGCAA